jgi:hypothetical protein
MVQGWCGSLPCCSPIATARAAPVHCQNWAYRGTLILQAFKFKRDYRDACSCIYSSCCASYLFWRTNFNLNPAADLADWRQLLNA